MSRIKLLIKSSDGTWDELKAEISKRVRFELGREFSNLTDRDAVFAQVNYRHGLSQIVTLLANLEKEILSV